MEAVMAYVPDDFGFELPPEVAEVVEQWLAGPTYVMRVEWNYADCVPDVPPFVDPSF
jgi:hypothetical protein